MKKEMFVVEPRTVKEPENNSENKTMKYIKRHILIKFIVLLILFIILFILFIKSNNELKELSTIISELSKNV